MAVVVQLVYAHFVVFIVIPSMKFYASLQGLEINFRAGLFGEPPLFDSKLRIANIVEVDKIKWA